MKEEEFTRFLEEDKDIISKEKAVNSRVSRARKVEVIFNINLDNYVNDDKRMFELLLLIKNNGEDKRGNLQNAVRKYYKFINEKEFPKISSFK